MKKIEKLLKLREKICKLENQVDEIFDSLKVGYEEENYKVIEISNNDFNKGIFKSKYGCRKTKKRIGN